MARALLLSVCASASGCDELTDLTWTPVERTMLLYSVTHPKLNLPAAYDFISGSRVLIESPGATGTWDLALVEAGGGFRLRPPSSFGIVSDADIASIEGDFYDALRAPSDSTAWAGPDGVALEAGRVYAVRTRTVENVDGTPCQFFARLTPLVIDEANLAVEFLYDANPYCNSLWLSPPS